MELKNSKIRMAHNQKQAILNILDSDPACYEYIGCRNDDGIRDLHGYYLEIDRDGYWAFFSDSGRFEVINRTELSAQEVIDFYSGKTFDEVEVETKTKGLKFDSGKVMMSLVPAYAHESVAQVLTFGAQKYAKNSWQHLDDFDQRYMDGLERHLIALKKGIRTDEESGLPHLAHLICNAMFLLEKELDPHFPGKG